MNAYDLVVIGKSKQGISSDRAYAIQNGLTVQNISDWKAGRASPNAANFLKLAIGAGMEINEALVYAEKIEGTKKLKQAGFGDVYAMTGLASLSLAAVAAAHHSPALMAIAAGFGGAIYIMRSN